MVEEVPAPVLAYRFTHELVRRALYDRLSSLRRAELHLRVGRVAGSRRLVASGRRARRPRPSFRGGHAGRRSRTRRRLQPARGGCRVGRARPRGGRRTVSGQPSGSGSPTSGGGRRPCSRSARALPHGNLARFAGGLPRSRRDRAQPRRRRAPRSSRIGVETRAGGRRCTTRAARELLEEASARSPTPTRSSGSGCSRGSPGRSSTRVIPRGGRSCARTRSRWRAGSATATGSRPCSCAPTGRDDDPAARTSSRCSPRRALSPRRSATSRSRRRRWSGGSRRSWRWARPPPRATSSRSCSTWRSACANPSSSTSPSTTASSLALLEGRLRDAELARRAVARVGPAS